MKPFVHLHNHTQYSLFDGLTRIPEMVKKAKDLGMPAVAITAICTDSFTCIRRLKKKVLNLF